MASSHGGPHLERGVTTHGDERRRELIQAAYELIAEKGLGGLRIRDVAARVGINNATLHYYFPTKESLIQAVVDVLAQQFMSAQAPDTIIEGSQTSARIMMQNYFASLVYQLSEMQERFVVMTDLFLAAQRDSAIKNLLDTDTAWSEYLVTILERGKRQGEFRADLDSQRTALMIIAFCKGIPLLVQSQPDESKAIIEHFAQAFFALASI